jgi:hypothetical protein
MIAPHHYGAPAPLDGCSGMLGDSPSLNMNDLTASATDCLDPVGGEAPGLVTERRLKEPQPHPFSKIDRQVSR